MYMMKIIPRIDTIENWKNSKEVLEDGELILVWGPGRNYSMRIGDGKAYAANCQMISPFAWIEAVEVDGEIRMYPHTSRDDIKRLRYGKEKMESIYDLGDEKNIVRLIPRADYKAKWVETARVLDDGEMALNLSDRGYPIVPSMVLGDGKRRAFKCRMIKPFACLELRLDENNNVTKVFMRKSKDDYKHLYKFIEDRNKEKQ